MKRLSRKNVRGAVLAEHVIAIVPILTAFFSFTQLASMATTRLAVRHGAIISTRAAIVFSNNASNNPGHQSGAGQAEADQAFRAAVAPFLQKGLVTVNVQVDDQSSKGDPYGWVNVTVDADYHCNGPLIGRVVCLGNTHWTEKYQMPHQGALYNGGT